MKKLGFALFFVASGFCFFQFAHAQDPVSGYSREVQLFKARQIQRTEEAIDFIRQIKSNDPRAGEFILAIPDAVLPPFFKRAMGFVKNKANNHQWLENRVFDFLETLNEKFMLLESDRLNDLQKRKVIKKISVDFLAFEKSLGYFYQSLGNHDPSAIESLRLHFVKELLDYLRADEVLVQDVLLESLKQRLHLPRFYVLQQMLYPLVYYPMFAGIFIFNLPTVLHLVNDNTSVFLCLLSMVTLPIKNQKFGDRYLNFVNHELPKRVKEANSIRKERKLLLESMKQLPCNLILLGAHFEKVES